MSASALRPQDCAADEDAWQQVNQRLLLNGFAALAERLRRFNAGDAPDANPVEIGDAEPTAPRLQELVEIFGLTPFERNLILLCAGVEMDTDLGALCAQAQGSGDTPTFSLALSLLPNAHWSALAPDSPLRHWQMLEIGPGSTLTRSPLRINERILHFLAGVNQPDAQLLGLVETIHDGPPPVASQQILIREITARWQAEASAHIPPLIQLLGPDRAGKRAVAQSSCATVGLTIYLMRAESLPVAPVELNALMRLWEREAALARAALLLDADHLDDSDAAHSISVRKFCERLSAPLFVACPERLRLAGRSTLTLEVRRPTPDEQTALWQAALGDAADGLRDEISFVTDHFDVTADIVRAAAPAAHSSNSVARNEIAGARPLWNACRAATRARMDDLAQRLDSSAGWDDLILPEAQTALLRDIAAHVRQRGVVYRQWRMGGGTARGLGISAMFAGVSGTGKTMAAEVLARELDLDLYRIDLSAVVSKYIGESEKNLRRVFDAAEESGAILLFDEADALFGKRSEVKDSHDRYANLEVSYLLQRMEAYSGLAILTTNLKSSVDTAFLRRLRFVVSFPFPDAGERERIWQRAFSPATPTKELDARKLAQLVVAGGNIRSMALNAAFLAADAGESVQMKHCLRAARAEYAKMEKTLTDREIHDWLV